MTQEELQVLLTTDPQALTYEQARDGLSVIVSRLEDGNATLEDSLALWERGEALAQRCGQWLEQAQSRLDGATEPVIEDASVIAVEKPPWL